MTCWAPNVTVTAFKQESADSKVIAGGGGGRDIWIVKNMKIVNKWYFQLQSLNKSK